MISTRDTKATNLSYTDVLLSGLAPDGGLYVPEKYPIFKTKELEALKEKAYADVAFAVKQKLVGGSIPDAELKTFIGKAYAKPTFAQEHGKVVPVKEINNGLYIQNLSLGPTASFKDMAMQLLGREMAYELKKRGETLTILGATSGDTGSAAEAALKSREGITLVMLSPEEGMSDFQKAQMGSLSGENIFNVSIQGRFDDCQDLVKAIKQDDEFANLGAVNSINWGRISSQIPYYFAGYLQVAKNVGDPVDVTVPSGNFGNILSGYIAKQMGLPIRNLIIATNENNVLDVLIQTGEYKQKAANITSSPSMDISKASNYERLVFDIFEHDAANTHEYMEQFAQTGSVSFENFGMSTDVFESRGFRSGTSTHADRIQTIKDTYESSKEIIDPHTADGVFTGTKYKEDDVPMICMETALPVKFEHTIHEALGFIPERPERFKDLESSLPDHAFTVMDANAEDLKALLRTISI